MIRIVFTMFVGFLFLGCSSVPTQTHSENTSLIVTYYGKEVYRSNTVYSTIEELTSLVNSNKKKYVIFSAPSCSPCKKMIRSLINVGYLDHVVILNLEEPWVAKIYKSAGLVSIPSMLVADVDGRPVAIVYGASEIVMYLTLSIKKQ